MDKFERLLILDKKIFGLYGRLITLKRLPIIIREKKIIKDNEKLKRIKRNKRCFIIGLGPSLKNIDLMALDGDIIVTNRFYKVDKAQDVNPLVYVINDSAYFDGDSVEDFLTATKKFPDSKFVLNGLYKNKIEKLVSKRDNFYYLLLWKGFFNPEKNEIDLTKLLPMSSNVIGTALYVALYMGYEEIILLGCDFNSFASPKQVHVYEDKESTRLWTMSNELFQYSFAADMHVQLDLYAKRHNQVILNGTEGSLIDAYERVSLDELQHK